MIETTYKATAEDKSVGMTAGELRAVFGLTDVSIPDDARVRVVVGLGGRIKTLKVEVRP